MHLVVTIGCTFFFSKPANLFIDPGPVTKLSEHLLQKEINYSIEYPDFFKTSLTRGYNLAAFL